MNISVATTPQHRLSLNQFWQNRCSDGITKKHPLLINHLCYKADDSAYYAGQNMQTRHIDVGTIAI